MEINLFSGATYQCVMTEEVEVVQCMRNMSLCDRLCERVSPCARLNVSNSDLSINLRAFSFKQNLYRYRTHAVISIGRYRL